MNLARKLALTAASAALGATLVGISAPATTSHAYGDSSWGCGGACRGTGDGSGTQDPGADEPDPETAPAPDPEPTEAP